MVGNVFIFRDAAGSEEYAGAQLDVPLPPGVGVWSGVVTARKISLDLIMWRAKWTFVKTIENEYSVSRERILYEDSSGAQLHKGAQERASRGCLPLHCLKKSLSNAEKYLMNLKELIKELYEETHIGLLGDRYSSVSKSALHILASMKRDWMQIKVVHICEATLTKRLIEFENTESGGLTIEEFNMKAAELEKKERLITSLNTGLKASGISELLCEHKGSGKPPFAHGLCESCYEDFIKLSGGLNGGSEPPAFQRAERERIMAMEAAAESSKNLDSSTLPGQEENWSLFNSDEQRRIKNMSENEVLQPAESDSTGMMILSLYTLRVLQCLITVCRATVQHKIIHDSSNDRIHAADATFEESDSLSDIDDIEVEFYLHSEEEKKFKKIIWEEMNKEYLEEQAAKEAAAIAAKKAYEANLSNCSGDVQAAQKLSAAAAAAVAKSRKERQQKRAAEEKNSGPAQTAAEAAMRMFDKKGMSSNKIRIDVLKKLFEDSEQEDPVITKKSRTEPESDRDDDYLNNNSKEDPEIEYTEDTYPENVEEFDYDDSYNHFDEDF
ncbi:hypothetical protein DH2020_014052 [Rehmannia glutinosa]|uniref:Brf1 TBP-binding domain-containing protein n=1 Tax=Rehmannia glutinosa TaxID=99300 RepID=A0ABR0WVC4_REHGL